MKKFDPTPQSPEQVSKNTAYKVMYDYESGSYYPSACEMVAMHIESGTYWKTVYRIREDDSDYADSSTWRQVVPEPVTIIRYNDIKRKP